MKINQFPKKVRVRILRAVVLLFIIGILISSGFVSAQEPTPIVPVPDLEGLVRVEADRPPKDANPKLDSSLNQLVEVNNKKGLAESQSFAEANGMVLDGGKVQVVLVSTPDSIKSLIAEVENLGGRVQANYEGYLQALLPIDAVQEMAKHKNVQSIRMPNRPLPSSPLQAVDVLSEGLAASNAPAWHSAGYDGTGVRVAVIDVGFTGYTSLLGSELPITSKVTPYYWTGTDMGGDEHGTANAEIVFDMAPGVTMDLHKIDTGVELGQAVTQAISDGVDIITMSLSWTLDGPGDGTGFLADIVNNARTNDILFVTSAGNGALEMWSGTYVNYNHGGDDDHAWNGISRWVNWIGPESGYCWSIPSGTTLVAGLHWDDWTAVDQDYDLYLYRWDISTGTYYYDANSTAWQTGAPGQTPEEYISFTTTATGDQCYGWVVNRFSSDRNVCLRLVATNNYHLSEWTPARSITFPADSPDAVAVGAVDSSSPYTLQDYSSNGPTFGSGGACSGGSIKPDISAYTNISTVSYGTGAFGGTSAATPHVAGAAALVKQFFPNYTVDQVQNFLENEAIDMGSSGLDNLYGWGRLYLPTIDQVFLPLTMKN